ncbi:DUF4382 domain-containing protein [Aurantivibrio infirmus]
MNYLISKSFLFVLIFVLGLSACRGTNDNDGFGNDTSGFTLSITDGPIEGARSVVIPITGIEVKPRNDAAISFNLDPPFEDNLLDFQNGLSEILLDDISLAEGEYDHIRLIVDDANAFIELNNNQRFDLPIGAGFESQLQINLNFTIDNEDETDFTIDFDLRKSVFDMGANVFELRPSLRLARTQESGTLRGTVAESLITSSTCNNGISNDEGNVVYLFDGTVTAQDIQGNAGDPIATGIVSRSNSSSNHSFTIGFLAPGNYTAVFTCNAVRDEPAEDNNFAMRFSNPENVTVVQGDSNNINFN